MLTAKIICLLLMSVKYFVNCDIQTFPIRSYLCLASIYRNIDSFLIRPWRWQAYYLLWESSFNCDVVITSDNRTIRYQTGHVQVKRWVLTYKSKNENCSGFNRVSNIEFRPICQRIRWKRTLREIKSICTPLSFWLHNHFSSSLFGFDAIPISSVRILSTTSNVIIWNFRSLYCLDLLFLRPQQYILLCDSNRKPFELWFCFKFLFHPFASCAFHSQTFASTLGNDFSPIARRTDTSNLGNLDSLKTPSYFRVLNDFANK